MHSRFRVALLLAALGASAASFIGGCDGPNCETDPAQFQKALEEGTAPDRGRCIDDASSSTGIPLARCDPSKNSGPVDNSCGVFVSSSKGDDVNDGSKADPVKTIARALEILPTRPPPEVGAKASIYVCAEQLVEEVTLPSGVAVFGSLDCNASAPNTWEHVTDVMTVLTAPEGKVPLRLVAGEGTTEVYDVHILAMSVPDTMPGVSSSAVIADGAEALFERSWIEAGNGAKGLDGEPYEQAATAGAPGNPGEAACTASASLLVEGPENQCATTGSLGGAGGPGGTNSGGTGGPGEPNSKENNGSGETSAGASCSGGAPGAGGTPGGAGDDATGQGKLDSFAGYIGVWGTDGKPGTPGQGGGGGGGSKSKVSNVNQCLDGVSPGASGGSGGAGGCGGAGGKGGGPGGSSIAVVSIHSKLSFSASKIMVRSGGAPGNGGSGQDGGTGGVGAPGGGVTVGVNLKPACEGGTGGKGGTGGMGGRGLGGHAIGVAYTGQQPGPPEGFYVTQQGTAVTGGIVAADIEFSQ